MYTKKKVIYFSKTKKSSNFSFHLCFVEKVDYMILSYILYKEGTVFEEKKVLMCFQLKFIQFVFMF